MSTPTRAWADLIGRAEEADRLIPEMGGHAALLIRDLRRIDDLGIPRDRRLLGADLDNLLGTIAPIVRFRRSSTDPEDLTGAALDATRLAVDMRVRAGKALRNEAQEVAIHASVAALGATGTELELSDLSHEFRLLVAAPASTQDPPGTPINVQADLGSDGFGRISGNIRYVPDSMDRPFNRGAICAPAGAVVIPSCSMVRVEAGDTFMLHACGLNVDVNRLYRPKEGRFRSYFVQVGPGGATIYGPAMISSAPPMPEDLLNIQQQLSMTQKNPDVDGAITIEDMKDICRYFGMPNLPVSAFTAFSLLGLMFSIKLGWSHPIALGAWLMAATSAIVPASLLWWLWRRVHRDKRRMGAKREEFISEAVRSGKISRMMTQAMPWLGDEERFVPERHEDGFLHMPYWKSAHELIGVASSANFLPPKEAEPGPDGQVLVMRPLLALPVPDPGGVVIPMRRESAIA